jgi:hypothetical protein
MPIRGGGFPPLHMDLAPSRRMEPPPWSLALDAHYCIMVRVLLTHRIQVRECDHSLMAGSPRNRRMRGSNYFDQRFLLVAESTQIGITLRLPDWLARECRRPRGKHSTWPRDHVLARPHVRRSAPCWNGTKRRQLRRFKWSSRKASASWRSPSLAEATAWS